MKGRICLLEDSSVPVRGNVGFVGDLLQGSCRCEARMRSAESGTGADAIVHAADGAAPDVGAVDTVGAGATFVRHD